MNKRISLAALLVCSILQCLGQSYVPEQNNARVKIKPVVDVKAYSFNLADVSLLESPFRQAMEADVRYLDQIEPDRLLSEFRRHSGLSPKAKKYGGWEDSGLAGHSLGHYLSAAAMHYAVTRDAKYLQKVNYIVDELSECQQARKTGYVGAIPKEDTVFREVSQGNIRSRGFDLNGAWSPWYTVHKVMAGLLDAYLYCGNEKALKVETWMAAWTGEILKNLTDEQLQKMLMCEYGGMNDVLVNTYSITGDKKFLDLSFKFHDKRILDSLALKIDVLAGKHSNTQVPKAIGTVRRYELTGAQNDLTIGKFFWDAVVQHHTYAPGGNSNYEYLGKPDVLNGYLSDNTMETCNTYNMLKLTRHLFALDPTASYMDFYERALYNHILASQNHSDGMMCYFVPLRMGAVKEFSDPFNTFTCCVGSGMENHVKYTESIYYKGKDGSLYINLFIPSFLNWKENDLKVTLHSDLPSQSVISLTINTTKSKSTKILIRKPAWTSVAEVKVNRERVEAKENGAGYLVVERKWRDGDMIEVSLPSTIHTMAMPDNPSRKAFFYGPVLLAGNLGAQEPDPAKGVPVLVNDREDANGWIKKTTDSGLNFKTENTGVPAEISFQPFYSLQNDYYSVYFDVFSSDQWKQQQKIYEENRKAERDLEERTIDILRIGEMQPERDHQLTGDKTETGESHTRKFRFAHSGGSFSFIMKTNPDAVQSLVVTYWGMDNRGRKFDILVDGTVVATEDLNKFKESKFYDVTYSIPTALTKGKSKVTVVFKGKPGNWAGPVYGVRVIASY